MDQEQLQASIFSDHRQYDFTNIPKPMLNGRFRQVILSRPMTDLSAMQPAVSKDKGCNIELLNI